MIQRCCRFQSKDPVTPSAWPPLLRCTCTNRKEAERGRQLVAKRDRSFWGRISPSFSTCGSSITGENKESLSNTCWLNLKGSFLTDTFGHLPQIKAWNASRLASERCSGQHWKRNMGQVALRLFLSPGANYVTGKGRQQWHCKKHMEAAGAPSLALLFVFTVNLNLNSLTFICIETCKCV